MNDSTLQCAGCAAGRLREIAAFSRLPRVTSDSKPYRPGGRLAVCLECGLVQKPADARWLDEIGEIYRDYEMYHQSAANDQAVFDPVSGTPRGRCEVLAQRLRDSGAVPASGALLDVGAGSGAMLAACSGAWPGWSLCGLDLDDRKEAALRAIPRFERLYTVPPEKVSAQFELVTLIHSLEHFPDPVPFLRSLAPRIKAGGRLFVQVNNVERTAFDLVVADHRCHFSPPTLTRLLQQAGFRVDALHTDWINKEISLLASPDASAQIAPGDAAAAVAAVERDVAWLAAMLEEATALSRRGPFGVFGTSVAATWLASGLGDTIAFYVDEDPAREGRRHLGRAILQPGAVPHDATVYLAFVPEVAATIRRRLGELPVKFATPPAP